MEEAKERQSEEELEDQGDLKLEISDGTAIFASNGTSSHCFISSNGREIEDISDQLLLISKFFILIQFSST